MQITSATWQPKVKEQECPQCQAIIPVHLGYVTWCDKCGWNLQPQEPERPRNLFESLYESEGKRLSRGLFDRVVKTESLKPALTFSKALAFALATIVHGFSIALVILIVLVVVEGWQLRLWAILLVLCVGIALFLLRHRSKLPDGVIPRAKFSALYQMADEVAQALDAANVHGIVIDSRYFNAAFSQMGWRRKPILYLGLPLFSILNGQERVALVAHELAHGVNGDPNRGFFMGTAIDSLITWYDLLRPNVIWAGLATPLTLMMWVLSRVAWLGAYALIHLLWHDSQRAEYLADYLAATVSGTDAMLSMLEKLHFAKAFDLAVHRVYTDGNKNLLDELRQEIANTPQRELDRIRRVERLQASRLDTTHPPTAYRIEFLQAHRVATPEMALSPAESEQLDRELGLIPEENPQSTAVTASL